MTTEPKHTPLKPCPFCAQTPKMLDGTGRNYPPFQVICTTCLAKLWPSVTREEATTAWNTRHESLTGLVGELVKKLEVAKYHINKITISTGLTSLGKKYSMADRDASIDIIEALLTKAKALQPENKVDAHE